MMQRKRSVAYIWSRVEGVCHPLCFGKNHPAAEKQPGETVKKNIRLWKKDAGRRPFRPRLLHAYIADNGCYTMTNIL